VLQKPFGLEQLFAVLRAEFGFPIDARCGFETHGTLSRGDRQLAAGHATGIPTPGL
jgi:hypothetical protein